MKNITVAISDQAYHDARVWAARRDTSLSRIVQNFLEALPSLPGARAFPLAASENETEDPLPSSHEKLAVKLRSLLNRAEST